MNYTTATEAVEISAKARLTSCLWGHRGIGKSSLVDELAKRGELVTRTGKDGKKETFTVPIGMIDLRLGQMEGSDIRGLPDKQEIGGTLRTVFLPPAELPIGGMTSLEVFETLEAIEDDDERKQTELKLQTRHTRGYLFLDEVNRAQDDVLQAIFQLILDRRVGQYQLPDGWDIVMASNFSGGSDYFVNGFNDSAFLDRFVHLQLDFNSTSLQGWLDYMGRTHDKAAEKVMQFCASNLDHLTGKVDGDLGFTVQPSPRSWDAAVRVMKVCAENNYSDNAKYQVLAGLIGETCANTYTNYTCDIMPSEVLEKGVKKLKDKILKQERNPLMGLAFGIVSFTKDTINEERTIETCLDFAELLLNDNASADKDIVISFMRSIIQNSTEQDGNPYAVYCMTNPTLAKIIQESDNSNKNPVIERLVKRKKLHKLTSETGWGKDIGKNKE